MATLPDELSAWLEVYLDLVISGVRSHDIAQKIELHLLRFTDFFRVRYGHERISTVLKKDVEIWMKQLSEEERDEEQPAFAPATVNNHLASLSGFTSWVHAQSPDLFALGNPCSGVKELPLPALVPRTLTPEQVISLKSLLLRLPAKMQRKGLRHVQSRRKHSEQPALHKHSRPYRDRAIIEVFLACGVRREELTDLNLEQIVLGTVASEKVERVPVTPEALRKARRVQLVNVAGKNRTRRNLFLGADSRAALADYLEFERGTDSARYASASALFLRAGSIEYAREDETSEVGDANGRLSVRAVNKMVARIGALHDAEQSEPSRKIGALHPHLFRHTYGFRLAEETNKDKFELQRRLGHQSEAYIRVYTTPPEEVAAGYVENF